MQRAERLCAGTDLTTHHRLRVAVLPGHGEVEAEQVAVDDVDVARLGPAQRVDAPVEGLVGAHLHGDARVLAVDGDWKAARQGA